MPTATSTAAEDDCPECRDQKEQADARAMLMKVGMIVPVGGPGGSTDADGGRRQRARAPMSAAERRREARREAVYAEVLHARNARATAAKANANAVDGLERWLGPLPDAHAAGASAVGA